jgi:hypothetical protein
VSHYFKNVFLNSCPQRAGNCIKIGSAKVGQGSESAKKFIKKIYGDVVSN